MALTEEQRLEMESLRQELGDVPTSLEAVTAAPEPSVAVSGGLTPEQRTEMESLRRSWERPPLLQQSVDAPHRKRQSWIH